PVDLLPRPVDRSSPGSTGRSADTGRALPPGLTGRSAETVPGGGQPAGSAASHSSTGSSNHPPIATAATVTTPNSASHSTRGTRVSRASWSTSEPRSGWRASSTTGRGADHSSSQQTPYPIQESHTGGSVQLSTATSAP